MALHAVVAVVCLINRTTAVSGVVNNIKYVAYEAYLGFLITLHILPTNNYIANYTVSIILELVQIAEITMRSEKTVESFPMYLNTVLIEFKWTICFWYICQNWYSNYFYQRNSLNLLIKISLVTELKMHLLVYPDQRIISKILIFNLNYKANIYLKSDSSEPYIIMNIIPIYYFNPAWNYW